MNDSTEGEKEEVTPQKINQELKDTLDQAKSALSNIY